MKKTIWPAFLASALVGFGIFHIWDLTNLAFRTLDFVRMQVMEPPAAPSWKPRSKTEGRPADQVRQGELLLGVRNDGDYAPAFLDDRTGALRAAGRTIDNRWVPIKLDRQGRVICSPDSFWKLNLFPGETMVIEGEGDRPKLTIRAE